MKFLSNLHPYIALPIVYIVATILAIMSLIAEINPERTAAYLIVIGNTLA